MEKVNLKETYNYDIVFGDNSFGHLILSPNGIIVTQNLKHNIERNFAINEGVDILQCIIQPGGTPVTLFNLRRVNKRSVVNIETFTTSSNIIYNCDFVIIGKHYNNINEIEIREITIQQNIIRQWLNINFVNVSYDTNNNTSIVMPIQPKTIYEHAFNDFNLSFNFEPIFEINAYDDKKFSTSYKINFKFTENKDINISLKYISKWQILHTLFTGQINNFDAISFSIPHENPISEQHKEIVKQDFMKMYKNADEDNINQLVETLNEQLPRVYLYMPIPKIYEEQLHFLQVPIPYASNTEIFDNILEKWFALDENMSQTVIYFFDALDKNKDIYQRFLSSIKLIEGFAEKYKETYFPENEIDVIKEKIKEKLKEYYKDANDKVINDFTKALKYTNKNKLNLEGRINRLIADSNIDYLNLNKKLVKDATDYRNSLSHSVNKTRIESINFITLYESYLKFLTFGFILLWKYLDIPNGIIKDRVKMLKSYQELEINNRLNKNE